MSAGLDWTWSCELSQGFRSCLCLLSCRAREAILSADSHDMTAEERKPNIIS